MMKYFCRLHKANVLIKISDLSLSSDYVRLMAYISFNFLI